MATAETLTMPPAAEGKVKKKTFLVGKFWNPDHTLEALKKMKAEGVRIYDVYSPFPLHGIEPYLDICRLYLWIDRLLCRYCHDVFHVWH